MNQVEVAIDPPVRGYSIRGVSEKAVLARIYSQGAYLSLFFPKGRKTSAASTTQSGVANASASDASCSSRPTKKAKVTEERVPVDLDDILEMRAAARMDQEEVDWKIDEPSIFGAYTLASMWCLEELKAHYGRYIIHTWSIDNVIER